MNRLVEGAVAALRVDRLLFYSENTGADADDLVAGDVVVLLSGGDHSEPNVHQVKVLCRLGVGWIVVPLTRPDRVFKEIT